MSKKVNKRISHANRGMDLEHLINVSSLNEIGVIQKIPTEFIPLRDWTGRVTGVKVEKKSTVDYIGQIDGFAVAIEAKKTNSDRIQWSAVKDHQAEFLSKWVKTGGHGFVITSFENKKFYLIPWKYWEENRNTWERAKRKTKPKIVNVYSWPASTTGMASARSTDFPTEWEIKLRPNGTLDYQSLIKKMISAGGYISSSKTIELLKQ